jgi:hypothetical protein
VVIAVAVLMGILGGLVVKALFLKESNLVWDAVFGAVGGVAAYFLYRQLSVDVLRAIFALGTAARGLDPVRQDRLTQAQPTSRALRRPRSRPGLLCVAEHPDTCSLPHCRAVSILSRAKAGLQRRRGGP